MMMVRVLGLSALLISLALWTSALAADGKLDVKGQFESHDLELVVATFTTADAQDRVGLLAWRSGQQRNAFGLRLDQWDAVFDLWTKAARVQGPAWKAIGSLSETGTSDVSRLDIKGGPGVALAVSSPKGVSIAYVLPAAEFARFEQAMRAMKADLESGQAKK